METKAKFLKELRGKGKIIESIKLNGPFQMATDAMLLEESIKSDEFSIVLRFYTWEGPWLSIGKNQKNLPEHWVQLFHQKKLNIVRRPSGGNAVLHSGGLTYSLIWGKPPREKLQAYFFTSQWLINCFSDLGMPLHFGNDRQTSQSNSNCFELASKADLIDNQGIKRIGSAQYWRKGNLLQHGEIVLDPPKELWLEIFKSKPPKNPSNTFPRWDLENLLTLSLKKFLPNISWEKKVLDKEDLLKVKENSKHYEFSPESFIRPDETIPSTKSTSDMPKG